MLFNSPLFIFSFLPIVLAGFFGLAYFGLRQLAIFWLCIASLFFYGYDNPRLLVPLILSSICFNFVVGRALARGGGNRVLFVGVAGNLALLGYFKYAGFAVDTVAAVTGLALPHPHVPLPIGISFFTFTQIAFLVDVYRGQAREYAPLKYGLFVTYFPHLIAGPILHHRETVPQFDRDAVFRPQLDCIGLGLAWFAIGLFKKTVLADGIAPFVHPAFDAASKAVAVGFGDAWIGTLSYTLQIYFDFSGYSDMAIGLALLIGITFPLNFNSPYQAVSLIDFWRRWNMTLSRFLRDYLYIPLGGNRRGPHRRYVNLMVTMVLGGLWHGATWNFVLWGALHGFGLAANHLWSEVTRKWGRALPSTLCWAMTLAFVVLAWVPFRADTFAASVAIWKGLFGLNGGATMATANPAEALLWIVLLSALALFAPNTQRILSHPWSDQRAAAWWTPSPAWAVALGCVFGIAVAATFHGSTVFLYFRF